jgi:F-type H+-transporting ATPase subunit alpha
MKQVAGTLRIDLAQFRELQAFAQFGSISIRPHRHNLLAANVSWKFLSNRSTGLWRLKAKVLVIWAASNGFTDDVAVEDVRAFEAELLKFVETRIPVC